MPRSLPVRVLQYALLTDATAPQSVIPLFHLLPDAPDRLAQQQFYLDHPDRYPPVQPATIVPQIRSPQTGASQVGESQTRENSLPELPRTSSSPVFTGTLQPGAAQTFPFLIQAPRPQAGQQVNLVTLHPTIAAALHQLPRERNITLHGHYNASGQWILVDAIATDPAEKLNPK